MKKILHIISSPRGDASMSIKLGKEIIEQIEAKYPGSTVKEANLITNHFPHLEEAHLTSFFTPTESRTPENLEAIKHSEQALQDIYDADTIVIGAPMYNFNIHSSLKAWIDHIVRSGVTFKYDASGPVGLITGKKVYVAIASGAVYTEGPWKANDYIEPYLKTMLSFIGMSDVTFVRIEGTMVPDLKDIAVEKGIHSIVID
jgi:FMN-dependent NADH-azoreductase